MNGVTENSGKVLLQAFSITSTVASIAIDIYIVYTMEEVSWLLSKLGMQCYEQTPIKANLEFTTMSV
jgi:hypothetical protein